MKSAIKKNLHVPLAPELHERLLQEARRSGRTATALARSAIEEWLRQARRSELAESVAAYAQKHAGSAADLDPSLEAAGLESLRDLEK